MDARLSACLVLGMLIAGCSGSPSSTPRAATDPSEPGAPSISLGEGSARVEGRVVDDELRPLEGAQVSLLDRSTHDLVAAAVSGADGGFALSGLPPGAYAVTAAKDGYRDAPLRAVDVEEAQSGRLDLVLQRLASLEPYHVTFPGRIQWTNQECVLLQGTVARCTSGVVNANLSKRLFVDEPQDGLLETVILEARWTPTLFLCANAERFDVIGPDYTGYPVRGDTVRPHPAPSLWSNYPDQLRSPVRMVIPRDGDVPEAMHSPNRTAWNHGDPQTTSGNWTLLPWFEPVGYFGTPVDVYCNQEQPIDYYWSLFFTAAAPDRWSTFPDA